MKFGVREICNIAFKCKANNTQIGDTIFQKDELVIYFDTAKTSTLEGSSTAVYAQGGRGNPRLVTWEGEKELTFSFEDALISPLGLSILVGANLTNSEDYYHHVLIKGRAIGEKGGTTSLFDTRIGEEGGDESGSTEGTPETPEYTNVHIDINDEILELAGANAKILNTEGKANSSTQTVGLNPNVDERDKAAKLLVYKTDENGSEIGDLVAGTVAMDNIITIDPTVTGSELVHGDYYYIDGYVKVKGTNLFITPDKFSDYFYIEAETLFRREADGVDRPAQFVIPKGKVVSNFNIAMANSGDPSTFNFEVSAMPDYVKFDKTKKVLCAISVLD